jgi:hypothetical protein
MAASCLLSPPMWRFYQQKRQGGMGCAGTVGALAPLEAAVEVLDPDGKLITGQHVDS